MHEKTNNFGFRPGPTQTGLYSHRIKLEASNFRFKKKRDCIIRVAKTKVLISFAVTAKLICAFVFAYADCWFFHAAAHILEECKELTLRKLAHAHTENFLALENENVLKKKLNIFLKTLNVGTS